MNDDPRRLRRRAIHLPRVGQEYISFAAENADDIFLVEADAGRKYSAMMSPGNFSDAIAHSSTPVGPRCPDAFT